MPTTEDARRHLDFNLKTNEGQTASRTVVDEDRGIYIACDVSVCDDVTVYSCDWEVGVVIIGGGFTSGGCAESTDLGEVARELAEAFGWAA